MTKANVGAKDLAARLASTIVQKAAVSVQEATLGLEPGGRPDGGSWKSASTMYFEDVCRDVEKCFWGANATVIGSLETGVQHLQAKLDEHVDLCGRLGSQPATDVMTPARENIARGLITLTEEYLTSKCLNPNAKTVRKLTTRVLDVTEHSKFDYSSDAHPAIQAELTSLTT